ncbi:MAG: DUF3232 domain-containing protein [Oscillospiraceae bacterium]|nr:DUF3232 domain-containing protein [Oscillospiraceae bacterium]
MAKMETSIQSARFRLDPDEYRETVERLDRNRKYAHDVCISNLKIINKLAQIANQDILFLNLEHMTRTEIAEKYILPIANEFREYNERQQYANLIEEKPLDMPKTDNEIDNDADYK